MTDMTTQQLLQQYQDTISTTDSLDSDTISTNEDIDDKIDNINDTLLQKAEIQKLQLREKLTRTVTKFLWVQLVFFNIVVVVIVLSVTIKVGIFKVINNKLASLLFEFLKYYISATIVELLGMLVFILHYVFSKYSGIEKIKSIKDKDI